MTFCKILDLARHAIPANNKLKNEHRWNKYSWMGFELRGKTLGIVGFGKIGSRVGEIAQGFKMNVVVYDPLLTPASIRTKGATSVSFNELLKCSDIISLHVPLNDETKNMISFEQFDMMKESALVLNMARGGVLDEDAALDALGRIVVKNISGYFEQ